MKIRTDHGPLVRPLEAQSRIPRLAVVVTGFSGDIATPSAHNSFSAFKEVSNV